MIFIRKRIQDILDLKNERHFVPGFILGSFGINSRLICGRFESDSDSILGRFGFDLGSIWGRFEIDSGLVHD